MYRLPLDLGPFARNCPEFGLGCGGGSVFLRREQWRDTAFGHGIFYSAIPVREIRDIDAVHDFTQVIKSGQE